MGESLAATSRSHRQSGERHPAQPTRLADTGLSTRSQIVCAWSGIALAVVVSAGFLLLAGYLPPPAAHWSADHIARFYRDNATRIRAGLIIGFLGWTPWALLTTVISVQLARMQPRRPVLAGIELVTGAAGFIFLLMSMIILLVCSFRPDRSPEITKTGPFSYQGVMVYWLAFLVFFLWILMLFWAVRRAALLEVAEQDGLAP
jgi:hypothetical protein